MGMGGTYKSSMSGKIRIYVNYSLKKGVICLTPRYHSKDTAYVSVVSQIWDIIKMRQEPTTI